MSAIIGSFLATLGFGIMFNIKGLKLLNASICGVIGYITYSSMLYCNISDNMALFIASAVFTLYAEIMAKKLKTPVTTFIVCALIILVPGNGMYQTMLSVIEGNLDQALILGIATIANAVSLALGTMLISTISKLFNQAYKK